MTVVYVAGSAALAILQLTSQWMLAKHWRTGWIVAMAAAIIAVPYEFITRQYGFLIVCAVGFFIALRAWRAWGTPQREHPEPAWADSDRRSAS